MKLRILIIGSSGMLGVDLCQELKGAYEIIGTDIIRSRRAGLNLPYGRLADNVRRFYECDITNKQSVFNVFKKANPYIVIHSAAWVDADGCELDPEKAYRVNSEGTKNLAEACKKIYATLIYISTDYVFHGKKGNPYKEIDRADPLSVYGDSKLKGERAIRKIWPRHFILRTGWLYGRHGKNFVDTILAKAKSGKVLKVVNDQVGSPTYTRDLAKAIHMLVSVIASPRCFLAKARSGGEAISKSSRAHFSVPYGIYHISNSGSVSWYDYAKEILRLKGLKTKVIPITSEELNRPAKRPAMSVLDNSKFMRFTDYRMRNWKKALKEYLG